MNIAAQLKRWAPAGLTGLVALVYWPSLSSQLLTWDDDRFISDNPLFAKGGWTYISAAVNQVQFQAYHPVHILSYLPDLYLWPTHAAGFLAINLVIFLGAVLVAYRLVKRHASARGAWFAVALLAMHPLCVQSVAWVTARKDCLSLLLFLATLAVEDARSEQARRPSFVALTLGALALLTKTSTVCLPIVLCAWLIWIKRARLRDALIRSAPYFAMAFCAGVVVPFIWKHAHMIPPARPEPLVVDVAASFGVYLKHMLVPLNLAPLYPRAAPHAGYLAAGVAVLTLGLVVFWRRLPNAARFASVAVVAALLPVVNIIGLTWRYSDRYVILALFVLALPLARALDRGWERMQKLSAPALVRYATVTGTVLLIVAGAAMSRYHVVAWQTSLTLWERAASVQRRSYFAQVVYGKTLRDDGQWSAATAQFQKAIVLDSENAVAYGGLFFNYAKQAESERKLAGGTADRWLAALGPAMKNPDIFQALHEDVAASRCRRCSAMLLLLSLKRWPLSDKQLLERAEAALALGARASALIHLGLVKRQDQRFRELLAQAQGK